MTTTDSPILIAGAGIGGLAAASALSQHGHQVRLLEKREKFSEAGAGIQLGPNASRILQELGLEEALRPVVSVPSELKISSADSGRLLATMPLGDRVAERYGAPYWVVHRHDLQNVLLSAVSDSDLVELTTGFDVQKVESAQQGVRVMSADGAQADGQALIGADGLWSTLCTEHFNFAPAKFAGMTAWRGVVDAKSAPIPYSARTIGLWMSEIGHVVHYPVRAASMVNIVVVLDDTVDEQRWSLTGESDDLLARVKPWPRPLRTMLSAVSDWNKWPLFERSVVRPWTRGRVTLLGDAAHPILPFMAQGGAMAIEDAHTIAKALDRPQRSVARDFEAYERHRYDRVSRVQQASKRMGTIYHFTGASRRARDLYLRLMPGDMLLRRFDWLYGRKDE